MNKIEDRKFVEKIVNYTRLPPIKGISINFIKQSDQQVTNFLEKCFPDEVEEFTFNYFKAEKYIDLNENYSESLVKILRNVTKQVCLCYWNFGRK